MNRSNVAHWLPLAAVSLVCALLAACGASKADQEPDTTPDVTIVTLKAQSVPMNWTLPGRAHASLVAEVRPQVSGLIKERLFAEGSLVKAGQPLYQLDDAIYRAQHESDLAALRKAEATLHAAQLAARRSHELASVDAVSQQEEENTAAAEAQAEAEVGVARAAADSSAVNLAYARIVAPISGRIGKSSVTQGALVTANQGEPLATIQQLDPVYVELNQSSTNWLVLKQMLDAGRLQGGQRGASVSILLENGSAYPHPGQLQFSDVSVDTATGNYLLRAVVPNPGQVLLPGMYVSAVVEQGVMPNAVLVPQQGITHDDKGEASAMIVDHDGKAQTRAVHLANVVGDQWLVDSGLVAGDRVIVEGLQSVVPGSSVHASEKGSVKTADAAH